jgi:hypothetical protein
LWGAHCASAGVTTFEGATSGPPPIPNGFRGFNFTNIYADANAPTTGYGYAAGCVSPTTVAYNGFGDPAEFSVSNGTKFDLNSVYMTAAWLVQFHKQGIVQRHRRLGPGLR